MARDRYPGLFDPEAELVQAARVWAMRRPGIKDHQALYAAVRKYERWRKIRPLKRASAHTKGDPDQ